MMKEPKQITITYNNGCKQILKITDKFGGDIKKLVQHVAQDNNEFNQSYTYKVI